MKSPDRIIRAALRLTARQLRQSGDLLDSPRTVRAYLTLRLAALQHETFGCLFLDHHNRLLADRPLFRGTLTQASVYPREVVREALAVNAAGAIYYHNHPSGKAEPSHADRTLTATLKSALALVDVRSLDHIVIGGTDACSMAERGDISELTMTDTTLLHAVLRAEGIRRAQLAALKQSETAERDAIVANLHDCFHQQAGVLDLLLTGDHGMPVSVGDRQQGQQVCHCYGITLRLGSLIAPEDLTLAVRSRTSAQPAHITITIKRRHPHPCEDLLVLPGHAPPNEVIAHYLAALMRHVHPHQLAGAKP